MQAFGIGDMLLEWIKNFFNERIFQTRVNDFLLAIRDLLSGVIRGGVLGPLVFLIIHTGCAKKSDTLLVSEFSTLVRCIICNLCLLAHHFH